MLAYSMPLHASLAVIGHRWWVTLIWFYVWQRSGRKTTSCLCSKMNVVNVYFFLEICSLQTNDLRPSRHYHSLLRVKLIPKTPYDFEFRALLVLGAFFETWYLLFMLLSLYSADLAACLLVHTKLVKCNCWIAAQCLLFVVSSCSCTQTLTDWKRDSERQI